MRIIIAIENYVVFAGASWLQSEQKRLCFLDITER